MTQESDDTREVVLCAGCDQTYGRDAALEEIVDDGSVIGYDEPRCPWCGTETERSDTATVAFDGGSDRVGPIIFSDADAREHLEANGEVLTFRTSLRTTGETHVRYERTGTKQYDCTVAVFGYVAPDDFDAVLDHYHDRAGFESAEAWRAAIDDLNGDGVEEGYLYRVTIPEDAVAMTDGGECEDGAERVSVEWEYGTFKQQHIRDANRAGDCPDGLAFDVQDSRIRASGSAEDIRWLYDFLHHLKRAWRHEGEQWDADAAEEMAESVYEQVDDLPERQRNKKALTDGGQTERADPRPLHDVWRSRANDNIAEWGIQDPAVVLLAIQEELGELTRAYLEATYEDGDRDRPREELSDLGALLYQLHWALTESPRAFTEVGDL
jgi:plasmid stabilization system protein ParE